MKREVRFCIWSGDETLADCNNVNKPFRERQEENNNNRTPQQGKRYIFYPNAHMTLKSAPSFILYYSFSSYFLKKKTLAFV